MTDGIVMNGGHSGGGGEVLDDRNPGATDNSPNDSIDQQEWGHDGAVVVRGVDLRRVYHRKYRILTLYFTCLCPNGTLVCWDKVP
jgi:hypothetical protein